MLKTTCPYCDKEIEPNIDKCPFCQKDDIIRVNNVIARAAERDRVYELNNPTITCPYCGSTDTKKIGTGSRLLSLSIAGLGSGKIGKQWHCKKCNSNF